MNINFLNETQNNSTLLDIFVLKSLDIEVLNNGTITDTINEFWFWFFDFWRKWVKSKLFQKVCEEIM